MSSELLNAKKVTRHLEIHEKQVHLLIKAGKIPCTQVSGKWIFPVKLTEEWIRSNPTGGRQVRNRGNSIDNALLNGRKRKKN